MIRELYHLKFEIIHTFPLVMLLSVDKKKKLVKMKNLSHKIETFLFKELNEKKKTRYIINIY